MRTYLFIIRFLFQLLLTVVYLIPYYILKIFRSDKLQNKFTTWVVNDWGKSSVKASGAKVTVHGMENLPVENNILFISNHQGLFDIPLILGYIPKIVGFIAKKEIKSYPILNVWMPLMHCVFMDRADKRQSARAISEGIDNIKKGYPMLIFPEGTRSKSNVMRSFKKGSFKMGIRSNAILIPLTISNSFNLFEANNNKIKAVPVELFIHKPIRISELNEEQLETLTEDVESIIKSKLPASNSNS